MVKMEPAIVFRGGSRRWFTRKAALRAEAIKLFRDRHPCKCEKEEFDTGYPGYACENHGSFKEKFVRRVARLIAKGST